MNSMDSRVGFNTQTRNSGQPIIAGDERLENSKLSSLFHLSNWQSLSRWYCARRGAGRYDALANT